MGLLRDIGPSGVVIIVIAALIIFGPKRLPELGRSIGKMFTEFKKSISGIADDEKEEEKKDDKVKE